MASVSRSKTTAPGLPSEFVPRPELLAALDDGEDRALTLVCAPPGYGKTLLLADWARSQDPPCAWVTLDEEDDDPRRLWTAVLAALTACPAVPEDSRLRRLVVPRTAVGPEFLTDLLEALAAEPTRIRLVLDDAHHLTSAAAWQGLRLLLRHGQGVVRLLLVSRLDPALPIARMRLEERLCELRTAQLRFSAEQTAALAEACGLSLGAAAAALLHERTDGWVAGIRLAALPLRGDPEPDRFIAGFSGGDRPVADYLTGEVFAHMSAEDVDLLRRTSIADPLPAALAAELSGRSDAADALAALEHSTGLVVSSGEHHTAFRVQELIRSYLAVDLRRHGPELAAQLHRQAAVWWSDQGRPVEALRHAARGGGGTSVAAMLHRWAPQLVARGEHVDLHRALVVAEGGEGVTDPWIPLVSAQIHLVDGHIGAAQREVRRAAAMGGGAGDERLATFTAATSRLVGLGAGTADPVLPPGDQALTALASAGRAVAGMFPGPAGGQPDAVAVLGDLEAALAVARDQQLGLLEVQCLCLLAATASGICDNARATAAATAAIAAATTHGWQESWWAATAHAVLAHSCLMQAAPDRALAAASAGLRLERSDGDPVLLFALRTARGGALFDLGDRSGGLLELQEARAELGARWIPPALAAGAALLEHRAALLLGFPAASTTSMGRLVGGGATAAEPALLRAWSHAAAGAADLARAAVRPLLDGSLPPAQESTVVEAWLVEVWGALRSGDRPAARLAMRAALDRAEPLDLLRPFTLAGQGQRALLVDRLGGAMDPDAFAFRCLAARRRVSRSPEPRLSAREQDVLAQLVSLSNLGEIAEDLAVSVNTVKTHVRAIYEKLGVNARRNAVLAALERGMLA